MSSKSTTVVKADASIDDHQRADQASDAFMVGIDDEGREHWYSRIRGTMTVLDDGEDETQSLNGRRLNDWMAFVEQDWGWDETNVYSGSTAEHLGHRVDEVVNGEER